MRAQQHPLQLLNQLDNQIFFHLLTLLLLLLLFLSNRCLILCIISRRRRSRILIIFRLLVIDSFLVSSEDIGNALLVLQEDRRDHQHPFLELQVLRVLQHQQGDQVLPVLLLFILFFNY